MSYKYCCVPMCESTTKSTPDKLFLKVPMDPIRRNKWFSLMRRKDNLAPSTNCYACEDHFNVEEVENIIKVRLVGGPIVLKKEAVPTKFHCQTKKILAYSSQPRPLGVKRMRQSLISDVLQPSILNDENIENTGLNVSEPIAEIPLCSEVDAETQVSRTLEKHNAKKLHARRKAVQTKACLKDRPSSHPLLVKTMQTSSRKVSKLFASNINSDSDNISSYVDDKTDKNFSTLSSSEPSDYDEESISGLESFMHFMA